MKFYTHKTTSISVIDVKFHKNPLFRLRAVQFFQTAGVKINGSYYRDTLLRQQLLPAIRSVSGDFITFQQDSVQPTVPMRRLRNCQLRHPTSSAQWIGHRTGLNILTVLTDINCDGLWVMLFKNSYFSKVKADLYETM